MPARESYHDRSQDPVAQVPRGSEFGAKAGRGSGKSARPKPIQDDGVGVPALETATRIGPFAPGSASNKRSTEVPI